ncbi:hypothetical protein ACFSQP_12190 [Bizionia sediminis]|uniref:Uncharacterized protein n=1 Tax=Bizionia sediminis TaxID=1737064 RepID=A0ABW5KWA0_9FLAO
MADSDALIAKSAELQVLHFAQALQLNDKQQEQAQNIILNYLKTEKFKNLITNKPDKFQPNQNKEQQVKQINRALLDIPQFQRELTSILNESQEQKINKLIPRE